jgi:hypothetical protein
MLGDWLHRRSLIGGPRRCSRWFCPCCCAAAAPIASRFEAARGGRSPLRRGVRLYRGRRTDCLGTRPGPIRRHVERKRWQTGVMGGRSPSVISLPPRERTLKSGEKSDDAGVARRPRPERTAQANSVGCEGLGDGTDVIDRVPVGRLAVGRLAESRNLARAAVHHPQIPASDGCPRQRLLEPPPPRVPATDRRLQRASPRRIPLQMPADPAKRS